MYCSTDSVKLRQTKLSFLEGTEKDIEPVAPKDGATNLGFFTSLSKNSELPTIILSFEILKLFGLMRVDFMVTPLAIVSGPLSRPKEDEIAPFGQTEEWYDED